MQLRLADASLPGGLLVSAFAPASDAFGVARPEGLLLRITEVELVVYNAALRGQVRLASGGATLTAEARLCELPDAGATVDVVAQVLGPGVVWDGTVSPRLRTMDRFQPPYSILSISGPGVAALPRGRWAVFRSVHLAQDRHLVRLASFVEPLPDADDRVQQRRSELVATRELVAVTSAEDSFFWARGARRRSSRSPTRESVRGRVLFAQGRPALLDLGDRKQRQKRIRLQNGDRDLAPRAPSS